MATTSMILLALSSAFIFQGLGFATCRKHTYPMAMCALLSLFFLALSVAFALGSLYG